jgi:hypothetical protein
MMRVSTLAFFRREKWFFITEEHRVSARVRKRFAGNNFSLSAPAKSNESPAKTSLLCSGRINFGSFVTIIWFVHITEPLFGCSHAWTRGYRREQSADCPAACLASQRRLLHNKQSQRLALTHHPRLPSHFIGYISLLLIKIKSVW